MKQQINVFGPVPSRRLGRSLGVDLVPFKTCSYDCIYCQLGRTDHKEVAPKEWYPLDYILEQIRGKLSSKPDYITFSGSGEPTLYSRNKELIREIKKMTSIPVAVLTNSSLLWRKEIRDSLLEADLVIPSLDAFDEGTFIKVNRPHKSLYFDQMLKGLIEFRKSFKGQIFLEVFLLEGINSKLEQVKKISSLVDKINPNLVQLNTVVRPPAEKSAIKISKSKIEKFSNLFNINTESIKDFTKFSKDSNFKINREKILQLLKRRPCTVMDISNGLGAHQDEVLKYVNQLVKESLLTFNDKDGTIYYSIIKKN